MTSKTKDMQPYVELGKRLSSRWSRRTRDAALILGYSGSTFCAYESGKHKIDPATLWRLSRILDVSIEDLWKPDVSSPPGASGAEVQEQFSEVERELLAAWHKLPHAVMGLPWHTAKGNLRQLLRKEAEKNIDFRIGQNLRRFRGGQTMKDVAAESGVNFAALQNCETGGGIDMLSLDRLCGFYGKSLQDVFAGVEGGALPYDFRHSSSAERAFIMDFRYLNAVDQKRIPKTPEGLFQALRQKTLFPRAQAA